MIVIHCLEEAEAGVPPDPRRYRVAGLEILAERRLAWLEPFAQPGPVGALPPRSRPAAEAEPGTLLFGGDVFLARQTRRLECRHFAWGFHFEVEGLGAFRFVEAGSSLEVQNVSPGAPSELLDEVLLGPLLALALARRGIFLLHASACELEGKIFLLLGESGAGKSTLAAELGGKRLADDQAAIDAQTLELLADFPQPKLDKAAQKLLRRAGGSPIAGILLLEKASPQETAQLHVLSPLQGAATILGHTTAARCFEATLLRAHLAFAGALAAKVPIRRLLYPHHPEAFREIRLLMKQSWTLLQGC